MCVYIYIHIHIYIYIYTHKCLTTSQGPARRPSGTRRLGVYSNNSYGRFPGWTGIAGFQWPL